MKTRSKLAIAGSALITLACSQGRAETKVSSPDPARQAATAKIAELEEKLRVIKDKEEADERLGQYAVNQMYKSPNTVKNLSPARMQVLARDIVRVANNIFDIEVEKQAFVSILQIESQFLKGAQSPTGPKGLAQLAKATFHGAMANCGVKDLKDDDVWETELNLYAGACYFKEQLVREKSAVPGLGYIMAAMVDYNQGPYGIDAEVYRKTGKLKKIEPIRYLKAYKWLTDNTTDQKMVGIPAIADLPKPKVKHKAPVKIH